MFIGGGDPGIPNWIGKDAWHVDPGDKGPRTPRRMKGKWEEASVEHDMPIVEETKKLFDNSEHATAMEKGDSLKQNLKQDLEKLGWEYNSRATFKANFPFRGKHLIFYYAFTKSGASDIHRLKVEMNDNRVSGYKLMKWMPK